MTREIEINEIFEISFSCKNISALQRDIDEFAARNRAYFASLDRDKRAKELEEARKQLEKEDLERARARAQRLDDEMEREFREHPERFSVTSTVDAEVNPASSVTRPSAKELARERQRKRRAKLKAEKEAAEREHVKEINAQKARVRKRAEEIWQLGESGKTYIDCLDEAEREFERGRK